MSKYKSRHGELNPGPADYESEHGVSTRAHMCHLLSPTLALGLLMAGCALLPALLVPQMNSTSRILGSEGHGVSRTASRVQSLLIGGQTAIAAPIMVAAVLAAITFAKISYRPLRGRYDEGSG